MVAKPLFYFTLFFSIVNSQATAEAVSFQQDERDVFC